MGEPGAGTYSVVVLYYRLGPAVLETLASVLGQSLQPAEVILVDNASHDEYLRDTRIPPGVRVLSLDENVGYAGGMNAGFAELSHSTPRVLFLTHEVLLDRECARKLVAAMDMGRHILVGPRLERKGDGTTWSTGGLITRAGGVRHSTTGATPVSWLDGACLMIDAASFEKIGGFDEDFFLYWEDVDLSSRMADLGTISVESDAVAHQDTALTPTYYRVRNRILFWRKRRRRGLAIFASMEELMRLVKNDLYPPEFVRLRARIHGVADGWSGELHPAWGSVRDG